VAGSAQTTQTQTPKEGRRLRRIIIIGTALAVLVGASVAYAALNTYTAKLTFSGKAGSKKSPAPLTVVENLAAANATAGSRAAPLVDIKTTIYGAVANPKPFPTCSNTKILVGPKFNLNCNPKSEVATGTVHSLLGGPVLTQAGGPCNPNLTVYNAGGGKLWYFFTAVGTQCGSLHTGSTDPYPGTMKKSGPNLVLDVPLPPFVSTAVAGHPNFYGSLINEVVHYKKLTTKVKGKTVAFMSSVGCKGSKRPYSVSFTATNGTTKETKVVKGSAPC
jgi:hypothetical protein